MDYRKMLQQARDLYNKAAGCEDAEERKDLMAQAEDLEERATAARKAAGITVEEETPEPDTEKLSDILANRGYSDTQIKDTMKALAGNGGFQQRQVDTGEKSFGDFLACVRFGNKDRLKSVYGSRFDSDAFKGLEDSFPWMKDMEEGSGVSGGYTVPLEQYNELLMVPDSPAVVRGNGAQVIPMRRRSLTIPALDQGDQPDYYWDLDYYGGVYSKWTSEGAAKHETEPEFKQIELVAYKLAGHTQASDELLADSGIGIDSFLMNLFRRSIALREDFAFLRGTGVGQPLGILNSGALIAESRDTANQIAWGDLTEMYEHMLPSSLSRSVWIVSQTALVQLFEMQDGAGNYMWVPNERGGAQQGQPGTLMGRPVIVTEKLPTLGNQGDILFADLSYYLIGDRQATTVQSSIHYAFVNDLTTWRFVHRVDGQPWLDAPIYIDAANQCSPFVTLAA